MGSQKIIEKIILELLDDDEFVYECKSKIEEIFEDKKIDINDIPEILSIIIIVSKKYYLFSNISEQDIYEIFSTLTIELFKKFKILEDDDPKINKVIQSSLKLLVLHINIKKSKCGWFC